MENVKYFLYLLFKLIYPLSNKIILRILNKGTEHKLLLPNPYIFATWWRRLEYDLYKI